MLHGFSSDAVASGAAHHRAARPTFAESNGIKSAGFVTARRANPPVDAEPRADVVILIQQELALLYQLATVVSSAEALTMAAIASSSAAFGSGRFQAACRTGRSRGVHCQRGGAAVTERELEDAPHAGCRSI